ncbi:diguanylate cyclase [Candidatus Woesearchaeota archaeon]|jgi:two-component system, cell cycle response regulator|nr:diguanylate cyclase [Candidatus Woesearchaeota archaeon]MBT6518557.1 diguanylate cyclase [Candidatus Woesearchaeota archaeon]MBT7366899.1 diguanylate cyclase [Candidatus Woesearchaeota archaeon]
MTITQEIKAVNGKVAPVISGLENKENYTILLVDDEELLNKTHKLILQADGYERIYTAQSSQETFEILEKTTPDIILMDLNLKIGDISGLELMEKISVEKQSLTPFVVVSAENNKKTLISAMRRGAIDYLEKPVSAEDLTLRIEKALIDFQIRCGSITDSMTGAANKKTLIEQIKINLKGYSRTERNISLAMFDIDNFKRYNDLYGHLEGDYIIKKVANIFSSKLRGSDIFARYGGEEFCILMQDTPHDSAKKAYDRIAWDFGEITFKPKKNGCETSEVVTFSAGISTLSAKFYDQLFSKFDLKNEEHIETILNCMIEGADRGLYKVKQKGKNGCYPYNGLSLIEDPHNI